jgi:transient receptor potential cation channel subfamily A protein 1
LFKILLETFEKRPEFLDLFNDPDMNGCTIMHYASKLGNFAYLKTFIQHGANVSTGNHERQSALHFAAKYGKYNSCLQILTLPNFKSHINDKDRNGYTPLHLAAQNGHCRVMKLLMSKGALISRSFTGNTPFHEASFNSHTDAMVILLEVDSNLINAKNTNEVLLMRIQK